MSKDIFARDEAVVAASRTMNGMIAGMRNRSAGTEGNLAARTDPARRPSHQAEHLSQVLSRYEAAKARGDHDEASYLDHVLQSAIDSARADRTAPRGPDGRFLTAEEIAAARDFDGGTRRSPAGRPTPGTYAETSSSLFARMVEASREEKADLEQEHTLT